MAGASREEEFAISAEKFYAALIDYKNYAEILPEVNEIEVLEQTEEHARIRYHIHVVKKISYTLKMTHKRPTLVKWELEDGNLFKKNDGCWQIEPMGDDKCRVKYELDIALKVFAPKTITQKLVAVNLPRMMKSFYEHAANMS
jgi:ribosome-associated toxin RatA of RatAB toxin-antitoxin module